jgi:tetratricopeptide (TPR) repeat protein
VFERIRSLFSGGDDGSKESLDQELEKVSAATIEERKRLLVAFCARCERILKRDPAAAYALPKWSEALTWLVPNTSDDEMRRLYEEADRLAAHALALRPDDKEIRAGRLEIMRCRGELDNGEGGRKLFLQVCQLAEVFVGSNAEGRWDADILTTWGYSLRNLAGREEPAEASRLFEAGNERVLQGCALVPDLPISRLRQAGVILDRASRYQRGEEQRQSLAQVFDICRELPPSGPEAAGASLMWGMALLWLAESIPAEAASLYREAEAKFAAGSEIEPGNERLAIARLDTQCARARLEYEPQRARLFAEPCAECQRLYARGMRSADLIRCWTSTLMWGAGTRSGADVSRKYYEAEELCRSGLTLWPSNTKLQLHLAIALVSRIRFSEYDSALKALTEATRLFQAILHDFADDDVLSHWSTLLYFRARLMPGEITSRLIADTIQRLEVSAANPGSATRLLAWGNLFWAQAKIAVGEESARFMRQAKEKLIASEERQPMLAAYHLACLCGEMGAIEECRSWLEVSQEPGITIAADDLARAEEFAAVRDCDWFRELLVNSPR